jgi:hypothetical protein
MCLAYEFYRNESRPEHAFILLATLITLTFLRLVDQRVLIGD